MALGVRRQRSGCVTDHRESRTVETRHGRGPALRTGSGARSAAGGPGTPDDVCTMRTLTGWLWGAERSARRSQATVADSDGQDQRQETVTIHVERSEARGTPPGRDPADDPTPARAPRHRAVVVPEPPPWPRERPEHRSQVS